MKSQWWIYAVVGGLAALAAVAIAGLPDSSSTSDTLVVRATPAPTTTDPPETTTTAAPTTTEVPLVGQEDLFVVVANAAGIAGLAGQVSAELRDLGYGDVLATDGSELVDDTRIYHVEGLDREALRIADEIGMPGALIALLETAPDVDGDISGVQLLPYLGRDLDDR
jgi:hypothetical protein